MKTIESPKNDIIKEITKLKQSKYRKKTESYLLEGRHELQEALHAGAAVQTILATETGLAHLAESDKSKAPLIVISESVSHHLTETKTSQGIFAAIKIEPVPLPQILTGSWLLLDNLQDPGNVGTLIRTADAAGFTGVILSPETVSTYNAKVQRAMQGSQFHLPLIVAGLEPAIQNFKANNVPVYGTALNSTAIDYDQIKPTDNFALIIGNEGNGISEKILQTTDSNLYIPIKGKAESLNAAIAGGILMFHLRK